MHLFFKHFKCSKIAFDHIGPWLQYIVFNFSRLLFKRFNGFSEHDEWFEDVSEDFVLGDLVQVDNFVMGDYVSKLPLNEGLHEDEADKC